MSSNNPTIRSSILLHNSLNTVSNPFSMPIHFVAIVGTENDFGMVFHFRLSLVSQKSATAYEAIRLDIRPNYTDPNPSYRMRAVVWIEYTQYAYSDNHGPRPFVVPVTQGKTAGMILNIIFDKYSMDKYIFVSPGQGCRHWCATVLERLAYEHLIPESVPRDFAGYELVEHARFGGKFPMPRIMGTWYF